MFPEFPQDFLRHCPKVVQAQVQGYEDPELFAECSFNRAGAGMMCENCKLHLTRPFLDHELDRKFLPKIEKYYRKVEEQNREGFEAGAGI